jgi:hypothetical protein
MKQAMTGFTGISLAVFLVASAGNAAAAGANGGGKPSVFTTLMNLLAGNDPLAAIQTGQPNQSCEDLGNQPGNAINAPGSPFNPNGHAGTVYAGEQPQNSKNPKSVSQYDVACARPAK